MVNFYSMTREKLAAALTELGEKPSGADTAFKLIYRGQEENVSERLKLRLKESFSFALPECIEKRQDDAAEKYLFRLSDGNTVETVLMKHDFGNNVCVSTQVGCNMGCKFCVSGQLKKIRDLTADEMTGQIMHILLHEGKPVSGAAIMGIGEPLDNFGSLLGFIKIISDDLGLAIGVRHITVSTSGIPDKIRELADSGAGVNLAVSLHAPTNELRSELMPVNRAFPAESVLDAAAYYSEKLNRRVTLEYVMLDGINDGTEQAEALSELIGGRRFYVNLIRYNQSRFSDLRCSSHEKIMRFYDTLKKHGVGVTMRRSLGGTIDAACGQLKAGFLQKTDE